MKTLLTLALAALTLTTFGATLEAPQYYQPEFEIEAIAPLCPAPKPGQVSCSAIGSKITISTTLGCLDKLVFHDVKIVKTKHGIELHSVAVALLNPMTVKAMCLVANTVKKTITVSDRDADQAILVNSIIQH